MPMVTFMKVIGLMIKHMVKEHIHMQMEHTIMAIGLTINNMDSAWSLGPMEQSMKASISMERRKVKES